ncbi:MAG: HAD family hydrolase [Solirubrobacteraceae bacterium]
MGEPVEGVLLDFAGTLFMPEDEVDGVLAAAASLGARLERAEAERLATAYAAAGRPGGPYPAHVPPELADAYARRDLGSDEHRTAYVGLLSTVDAPVAGLAEALYERVRLPEGFLPYPDAGRLLAALRARGLRTALVSNIGFDLRPVLAGHGLEVDAFALSCELGITKPDERMFHAACEAIGVAPGRALMVGDHVADGGAADAGLRTLLLPMTPAGSDHGLDAVLGLLDALGP